MIRIIKKGVLLGAAVVFLGVVQASPVTADEKNSSVGNAFDLVSNFQKNDTFKLLVPIQEKDMELYVGGNTKIDMYKVRNGVRLTKNIDDQVNQWRQRIKLGVQSNFGKKEFNGTPIAEASLIAGATLFWRSVFTKKFGIYDAPMKQDFINPPVTLAIDEAWFKFNLETLTSAFDTMPVSVKAGFFPYCVGRGISMGDRSYGGVTYMGFSRQNVQNYMPKYAPGVLLHAEIPSQHLSWDFYYSPFVSENASVYVQDVSRNQHIVDMDDKGAHGRHLFSFSMAYLTEPAKDSSVRLEPYMVYYKSQRQTVESPSDSPISFTTFGTMIDVAVGQLSCNLEMATQHGYQDVLPWIDTRTTVTEYHPGYKIKLGGSMFMFDMKYQMEEYSLEPAMAIAYFSGGDYPYNDTVGQYHAQMGDFATLREAQTATDGRKDKVFKGFLPLRDWGYRGMWCSPLVMFSAGVIPRPVDFDLNGLTTYNDSDCATNLMLFGFGGTWRPLAQKEKLSVATAMFFCGMPRPPLKWNKTAAQPGFVGDNDSIRASASSTGIVGWQETTRASSFLGVELDMVVNYKVTRDCELSVRAGAFFPGTLYGDTAGKPNINSAVVKNQFVQSTSGVPSQSVVVTNNGLGRDPAYGLYVRMGYDF
ncbi:hypothetical protein FJ366_00100 [Candidatus Dependentiae bacterium]|nr:hypothetical protein [Candidatus Dependentiae bacterium]